MCLNDIVLKKPLCAFFSSPNWSVFISIGPMNNIKILLWIIVMIDKPFQKGHCSFVVFFFTHS